MRLYVVSLLFCKTEACGMVRSNCQVSVRLANTVDEAVGGAIAEESSLKLSKDGYHMAHHAAEDVSAAAEAYVANRCGGTKA